MNTIELLKPDKVKIKTTEVKITNFYYLKSNIIMTISFLTALFIKLILFS